MKRALVILLVMVIFCVPAFAEDIDVDSMTLDELVILRNKVVMEIRERLSDTLIDNIYPGKYVVGIDIEEGIYLITGMTSDPSFMMWLYEESDSKLKALFNKKIEKDDFYCLQLRNNMVLEVTSGEAMVTLLPEPSWAP